MLLYIYRRLRCSNKNQTMFVTPATQGYRYLLGAFIPGISGHLACFLILTSSEVLPFKCLNFGLQSVNGFVLLLMIKPFSQSLACSLFLKPLRARSRGLKCELKSSIRLVLLGQLGIFL